MHLVARLILNRKENTLEQKNHFRHHEAKRTEKTHNADLLRLLHGENF